MTEQWRREPRVNRGHEKELLFSVYSTSDVQAVFRSTPAGAATLGFAHG